MGIASRFEGRELACVRGGRIVFARLAFDVTGGGLLILRGPNGLVREGCGVLEQLVIGAHAPSGFKSLMDMAT